MKEYIEKPDGSLLGEGMSIPADNGNRHYREFLELERQGLARKVSAPPIDPWIEVKLKRNNLLAGSDWTQLPDNNLTARQKSAWRSYRKQLRNVTSVFNKPENIVWPDPPLV
tara:strand:- start:185 stop:520 length:336 start_codon:yes stop_codon:yes gene_type:complete